MRQSGTAQARGEGFALFDTPIGRCGIAWGPKGIRGLQLPERSESATRVRIARRVPAAGHAAPPPAVQCTIGAVVALVDGEQVDLGGVRLDWDGVSAFDRKVYEATRAIPPGTTVTYGNLAAGMGAPDAAQAVGQALGRNPFPLVVPCHRVVAARGPGGFSATGGVVTKQRLLAIEQANCTAPGTASGVGVDASAAAEHLRRADPALGRIVDLIGPFELQRRETASTFGALAEAIVYQQLSPKAAGTIFGRLCAQLAPDGHHLTPEQVCAAADEELRSAGLSRPKRLALGDLAGKALDGTLPTLEDLRVLSDESVIDLLTEVRGIGRWTAEMFLIFHLGRPDVLPVGDYGLRRGFQLAFGTREVPSPDAVTRRGRRWAPHRTAAGWYLWRAVEQLT